MNRFRNRRIRRTIAEREMWLTSANGDHRPEIDRACRAEIAALREEMMR